MTTLHQFTDSLIGGDAISDHLLAIRGWLRGMGYHSDIYAANIDSKVAKEGHDFHRYRSRPGQLYAIYHHSIGSDVADWLLQQPFQIILIYHNITPAQFFTTTDPALVAQVTRGREQLVALRDKTILGLAVSPYNEQELLAAGFPKTGILPLAFDPGRYNLPPDPALLNRFATGGPNLLFVGRVAPNKKQEDLIKLLYAYHRIRPEARLLLVGSLWLENYVNWLNWLIHDLDLRQSVHFLGHTNQAQLVAAYQSAHLFVSMSEHEGFGMPLLESIYFNLPIMAYAAAGIPGTLGPAGVLFHHKEYEALAELADLLITDQPLRQRLITQQSARLENFLDHKVAQQLRQHLQHLNL